MNVYCHNCASEWDAFYTYFVYKNNFIIEDYKILSCPECEFRDKDLSLIDIKIIQLSDDMVNIQKDYLEKILMFIPKLGLKDLITVCCSCRKIKDGNKFITIKDYLKKRGIPYYEGLVEERLMTKFSKYSTHGICPECFKNEENKFKEK